MNLNSIITIKDVTHEMPWLDDLMRSGFVKDAGMKSSIGIDSGGTKNVILLSIPTLPIDDKFIHSTSGNVSYKIHVKHVSDRIFQVVDVESAAINIPSIISLMSDGQHTDLREFYWIGKSGTCRDVIASGNLHQKVAVINTIHLSTATLDFGLSLWLTHYKDEPRIEAAWILSENGKPMEPTVAHIDKLLEYYKNNIDLVKISTP